MAFDIEGALKAGYSKAEVADFLVAEKKFDAGAARESGYSDDEIISHLNSKKSVMDRVKDTASSIGQGMLDMTRKSPTAGDYERANESTQKTLESQRGTDQPKLYERPENASTKTATESLTDPAKSFGKGAGTLARSAGWLTGSETVEQWGKDAEAFWSDKQSQGLKESLSKVEQSKGFLDTLKTLGENPDALVDMIAQSLPMMAPGMGVGMVGSRAVGAVGYRWATAAGMNPQLAAQVAEKAATRFAIASNVAGEGAVSGGAVGSTVEESAKQNGATDAQAKSAANEAALKAGLWTAAGATVGAGMETRAMLGKLKDTGMLGAAKNIGKEMAEEAIQNPGEEYFQYQGVSKFDPDAEFDLGKSVATGLAAGGVMGGGFHAAGRLSSSDDKPSTMAEQRDSVLRTQTLDDAIVAAAEAVDTPAVQTPTAAPDRQEATSIQQTLEAMADRLNGAQDELQPAGTDAVLDTPGTVSPSPELVGSHAVAQLEPAGGVRPADSGAGIPGSGDGEAVPVEPARQPNQAVKEPSPLGRDTAEALAKRYGAIVVNHPSKPGMFAAVPPEEASAYTQSATLPATNQAEESTAPQAVEQSVPAENATSQATVNALPAAEPVSQTNTLPEPVKETPKAVPIEGRDIDGDWAEFSPESGTLAVPRAEMPQIKAEHRGAMVNFLNARGVEHEEDTVPAASLKPTQAEFSRQKVEKAKSFEGGDRAILVSEDGHVVDGHHQWMAKRDTGEDVRVIRLKAPVRELLKVVPEFPSATVDDQQEKLNASERNVPNSPATEQGPEGQPVAESPAQEGEVSGENKSPAKPAAEPNTDSLSAAEEVNEAADLINKSDMPTADRVRMQAELRKGQITPADVRAAIPKIEDFGEKIGGARKDVWTSFKDSLEKVSDADIAEQPLSKIWPAPDYQALIDSGMDAEKVAFVRSVRDELPAKPRKGWKLKGWAEQVKTLRQLAIDVMDGTLDMAAVRRQMTAASKLTGLLGRMELYVEFGHSKSLEGIRFGEHHYSFYKGRENVNLWVVERDASATAFSNWPQEVAVGDSKEEALEAFRKVYDRLDAQKEVRKASFDIYTQSGTKGFLIGKKIGRNLAKMAGPFDTLKEARDYRENNLTELNAKLEKFKEIPRERRDSNNPRVGEDMRNGQDVTPQMFGEAFGFKGVEFGNWVEQGKRQKDLNDAYDALMDMAAILEIPAKAISLNGELGLAFGARGSGGIGAAAAHYEPDFVVINLTKKEGAGSLGHEWWHALDNYFSRMRAKSADYATEALDVSLAARESNFIANTAIRKEMVEAFGAVVRSIKNTALKARSAKLDGKRTKEYWTTGREMSARAFESYLISKLQDQNASNDYLANIVDEETWKVASAMGFELDDSYPYPTAGEMPVIREGFEKFFQTIETRETDKGVALFSRAGAPLTKQGRHFLGDDLNLMHAADLGRVQAYHVADPSTGEVFGQVSLMLDEQGMPSVLAYIKAYNKGDGERILKNVLATAPDGLYIDNMLPDAVGFWKKMGTELIDSDTWEHGNGILTQETYTAVRGGTGEGQADGEETGTRVPGREDEGRAAGEEALVEQVEGWIAEPLSKLQNIPNVRVVADQFEIPEVESRLNSLRERALNLDAEAAREIDSFFRNPVEGAYIDGEIWLVASSLPTKKRALEVLAHESVGHLSVEQMLDASDPELLPKLLKQVNLLDKAGNPYITELGQIVDRRQPGIAKDQRAKEIIALIAERGDDAKGAVRPVWQRIMDGIKAFFKLVFNEDLSDADVREIVSSARRWAEGEHVTAGLESVSLEPSFSRGDADQKKIATLSTRVRLQLPYLVQLAQRSGHSVATDEDVVKGRGALFSRADTWALNQPETGRIEIIGDSGRQYTAAQKEAFKNTGRVLTHPRIKERVAELWQDAGKKMAQGIVDQFAPVKELSTKAYTLLRLSKGSTGAFEALMKHGKLSLNEGAYDATNDGGVLDKVFFPLGKESSDFLYWVAGNRAEKLAKEGREHLFTQADIAAYKSLDSGTTDFDYTMEDGRVTRDRTLIYRDSLKKFNGFNKNVLDMAEQSGLIDGGSRSLWESEFYVPFYRVADEDDGGVRGMNIKKGVVRQEAFKKLQGGTEGLNDLLSNTLMNWAHLIDASAKNRGAEATLEAAERFGSARKAEPGEKKTVWFMKEGKRVEYKVDDPYLLAALNGLEYAGLNGPAMKVLTSFKHWLTIGVTASPFFKVRNLVRDSMQSIAVSDLGYNPISNIKEGIKLTKRDGQEYVSALAGGGLIRFGTMLEGNEAKRTRQLIQSGAKEATILNSPSKIRAFYDSYLEPAVNAYNEIGNRGEEINRMTLFAQLKKQGVDHATANLLARDLMDFSMQGAWTSIRFLTQTVPFLNARLQGMYKLGRSAKERPAKMAAVTGAVALVSLALLAAYGDDDDWKKREDWDRDNYWWFKLGGIAFRIPKPFEIGAVATLAERSAELMFDDEMTGKRFKTTVTNLLSNQLAMNPVPQAFKPLIDLYANKDSFTGRPIETMGMEKLESQYRYRQSTSAVARGVSTAGNAVTAGNFLSPVQIDHLVRGYFSWLGAFVVGGADMAVRAMSDEPTRPAIDYWKMATGGIVAKTEGAPSRYVSQMYEQAQELEEAYGTWRNLIKSGKAAEAAEYRSENMDKLQRYKSVVSAKQASARLNERIRMIERSNADPETKRAKIDALKDRQNSVAKTLSRRIGE